MDLSAHIEQDLRLHSWEVDARIAEQLRDEQARLIWDHAPLMLALGLLIGVALVAAQWPVIDHGTLAAWSAILLFASATWGGLWAWYRRLPGLAGTGPTWIHIASGCALLYGLAWCCAALLLFPEGILVHQAILTVMLSGVCAGSIAILSATSITGITVVMFTLVPLGYQFALVRSTEALLILSMLLVLLLTLVLANRHLYQTLREALRLRIEKTLSEAALHESETRYRLLFTHLPLGVLHYDTQGEIVDCNDTSARILGSLRRRISGSNLLTGTSDEALSGAVRESLQHGWGYYEDELDWNGDGEAKLVRGFFSGLERADHTLLGGVAILEDFSSRKRAEDALHHLAYYDPLTDLPNRRLINDQFQRSLSAAERHGRFGALIFFDIDYFKRINDRFGHQTGDAILHTVAERLRETLRREDAAARLSGDEFVLLLPELATSFAAAERSATAVCEKLQSVLHDPMPVGGDEMRITVSMGVTIFPQGSATADTLISRADTAMYRAKRAVRGDIRFFEPEDEAELRHNVALENDLASALDNGEMFTQFQGIHDAQGRLIGAELLTRWEHPVEGRVTPDFFIAAAEESGLIIPLGRWVIDQACRALASTDPAVLPSLSVNISPRQFHHRDFIRHVTEAIDEYGVADGRLVFEVTENVLIDYLEPTIEKMEKLRERGVRFEVDDFGTGYSSLTYLKRLPVEGVKIDRAFIEHVETDASNASIVRAIVSMASGLGLYVIAEGVEHRSELEFLERLDCERFQGFLWDEPGTLGALTGTTDAAMS